MQSSPVFRPILLTVAFGVNVNEIFVYKLQSCNMYLMKWVFADDKVYYSFAVS